MNHRYGASEFTTAPTVEHGARRAGRRLSASRKSGFTGVFTLVALFAAMIACCSIHHRASADEPEADPEATSAKVSFHQDVRPILQTHCQGCHQPAKSQGGLVLTTLEGMLKGGESETPAVVPGKPDESEMVMQITPDGDDPPSMPRDRPPLSAQEIETLHRWVAEGAVDDSPASDKPVIDMRHPPVYKLPPVVASLDYAPDGSLLAVAGYHEVLLFKPDGSELVARLVGLSERIESVAFSPDGSHLAVTGGSPGVFGEVQIWDVASREMKLSLSVTFDTVYGGSWSPDGTRVAFGCADNTLRAIEAETGKQVLFQGAHSDWVLDTVFSNDASHLMSVSRDRSMKLIEVATEQFVDNITSITPGALEGGLIAVDRHPGKDHVVVGGADGVPKVYQIYRTKARQIGDDFNLVRKYEALGGRIFDVAFNADGSRFVAGSSKDGAGEVRVYQTDDGKVVSRCEGQQGGVYAVAFRQDGLQVASAGFDGVVRINDVATGKLITQFVVQPEATQEVAAVEE
jgi:mono/diheme cytochrome c family protein/outer membrane protein assembly factor BamB